MDKLKAPIVRRIEYSRGQMESLADLEQLMGGETLLLDQPNVPLETSPARIHHGSVWLCGERLIRLRPSPRRILHIRHLYKYLDKPLPQYKRFYFHD